VASEETLSLIKNNKKFRLTPFHEILEEILQHFGSLEALKGRNILELGPGARTDLMRFLDLKFQPRSMEGAGRSVVWPFTSNKDFIRTHVKRTPFLKFFDAKGNKKYDLIFSRFVMEKHSISPWILLFSKAYWAQFKKKKFSDFDKNYPASLPNIQAVFTRAFKSLKPGGVIISLIAKKKNSGLDQNFLKSLKPVDVMVRDLRLFSSIVTVKK